ncbi:ABC transporter permease [Deinococcus sp.]|uniref:ABC transporter permease n=1 Tax=Deinococcus sp. TaxID=47478 RepID=UPI003B5B1797
MNQAVRSLLSRPLESLLLLLTIAFGAALSGLVLSAAWPSLGGNFSQPGILGHELSVQKRDSEGAFSSSPTAPPVVRVGPPGEAAITLKEDDLSKLQAQAPDVQVAYLAEGSYMGDQSKGLQVSMVTRGYVDALRASLVEGSLPSAAQFKDQQQVVVLTEYAARFLFPNGSALGKEIQGFRVIGVISVPPADGTLFRSAEQSAYGALGIVPYGSARLTQGNMSIIQPPLSTLRFLPRPGRDVQAQEQLSRAARRLYGEQVSVNSNLQDNIANAQAARRGALSLALLGVGGLLIASLSILALMLARVLSRARLLGMAAALGASRARLRGQYLSEIAVLGSLGSVLGGLMAAGLVWWLGRGVSGTFAGTLSQQPAVLLGVVIGSLLLSILFGLVPAIQASKVRPAEALRG